MPSNDLGFSNVVVTDFLPEVIDPLRKFGERSKDGRWWWSAPFSRGQEHE